MELLTVNISNLLLHDEEIELLEYSTSNVKIKTVEEVTQKSILLFDKFKKDPNKFSIVEADVYKAFSTNGDNEERFDEESLIRQSERLKKNIIPVLSGHKWNNLIGFAGNESKVENKNLHVDIYYDKENENYSEIEKIIKDKKAEYSISFPSKTKNKNIIEISLVQRGNYATQTIRVKQFGNVFV